ncbi:hypothetical protein [Dactylosporangium sp. CA-139066]|uniref:hypothetical protein n=1 Tax=Dactylosporangium sp. CA-139066 TaxID=3239930 RepID=UPI003D8F4C33
MVPAGDGAEAWSATAQARGAIDAWQRYLDHLAGEVTRLADGYAAAAAGYNAADRDAMRGHPWTKRG